METSLGMRCASQGNLGNPETKLINEKPLAGLSTSAYSQGLENKLHYWPPQVIRVDRDRSFCRVWREPDLSAQENKYIQASDGSFKKKGKKERFTRLIDACTPLRVDSGCWPLEAPLFHIPCSLQSKWIIGFWLQEVFFSSRASGWKWTTDHTGKGERQKKKGRQRRMMTTKESLIKRSYKTKQKLLMPDGLCPHWSMDGLN